MIKAKRENRVSKGATNLPIEVKDTLRDLGATDSNDALRFGTGLTVEEWETNRTSYSARGFDIMLTQIDGLGMTNAWGIAESQLDTHLFEKIELIRGANGLLTGVGNASGTINYVRKRPTNEDGLWAGRLVVAQENKDSYLRGLGNERTALSGIVEGQVGDNGILALGLTYQDAKQRSPMWSSLTLPYANGSLAEFDVSASTSQDWTRWNNRMQRAFVEYTHALSPDWEAKLTYNHAEGDDATKLFYAYTFTGHLNDDNTGLNGWPYRSEGSSSDDNIDVNLSGKFNAFGRQHDAVFGLSHSKQKTKTETYAGATFPVLPAFPYAGDVFPEPVWGAKTVANEGDQQITRLYASSRLQLTDCPGLRLVLRHLPGAGPARRQPRVPQAHEGRERRGRRQGRVAGPQIAVWDGRTLRAGEGQPPLAGYGGDICALPTVAGGGFAVSCPRANGVALFNARANRRRAGAHPLRRPQRTGAAARQPLGRGSLTALLAHRQSDAATLFLRVAGATALRAMRSSSGERADAVD